MRYLHHLFIPVLGLAVVLGSGPTAANTAEQAPLLRHNDNNNAGRNVTVALFAELEELARIVDISYCVGLTSFGIIKPFNCLSRCADFPDFDLVTTWNTGPLLSDSSGYIALDHGKERLIVAFRGTYSIANTVVDLSTIPQEYVPYLGNDDDEESSVKETFLQHASVKDDATTAGTEPQCRNCTVHMGFYRAWRNTRSRILPDLQRQRYLYPHYQLHLVGHSLGGAVAALAGLDLLARGWNPTVTTYGEPRIGNKGLVSYIDDHFHLLRQSDGSDIDTQQLNYRRVTHVDDPVPLLPLREWGYEMHAGEIFISKCDLSPDVQDVRHCVGDNDLGCMAGQDSAAAAGGDFDILSSNALSTGPARDLLASVEEEVADVVNEPWGIPSRYKLWQLFFAHRDYFWRLGLCVPGGDSTGGGGKYPPPLFADEDGLQ